MNMDCENELIMRIKNVREGVVERIVPESENLFSLEEHYSRYRFASNFTKNKIVLDVACGVGYGSDYLMKHGAKKILGLDKSNDAIRYAIIHYDGCHSHFILGDVSQLPFPSGSLDAIVSFETIEHITNPQKFLQDCNELLRDDGIFICSSPNRDCSQERNPHHNHEFQIDEFKEMIINTFGNCTLYSQNNENIIIILLIKILYSLPFHYKIIRSLRKIIYRNIERGVSLSYNNGNKKKCEVVPYNKSSFFVPNYIISVSRCKR